MTCHECADLDPILWAEILTCATCGRRLVPVEAVWWDSGQHVLASYKRACWHTEDCFVIGRAMRLSPGELEDPVRQQCSATARTTGRQCRNLALADSGWCAQHQPTGDGDC